MTNIDKIIKFDFKHVRKLCFYNLAAIAASIMCFEIFNMSFVFLAGVLFVIFQNGQIGSQIYGEGLFGDGETMYKAFPIEAEELMISKLTLSWIVSVTGFAAVTIMGLFYWGVPGVELHCIPLMYSAAGMLYRFGILKCVAIVAMAMLYVLEMEMLSMAFSASKSGGREDEFSKESILWAVAYVKSIALIILSLNIADTHLKLICMFVVGDILLNTVFCYFALRYTKAVIEGRR